MAAGAMNASMVQPVRELNFFFRGTNVCGPGAAPDVSAPRSPFRCVSTVTVDYPAVFSVQYASQLASNSLVVILPVIMRWISASPFLTHSVHQETVRGSNPVR